MYFYLIFHELKITYEKRTFSLHTLSLSISRKHSKPVFVLCGKTKEKRFVQACVSESSSAAFFCAQNIKLFHQCGCFCTKMLNRWNR